MTPSKQKCSSQNVTTGPDKISKGRALDERNSNAATDRAKYNETRNSIGQQSLGTTGQKNGQISRSSFRQTPPLRENDQERHLTPELTGSSSIQASCSSSMSGAVPLVSPIISGNNKGGAKKQSNQGCGNTGSTVIPAVTRPRANIPKGESGSVRQPLGNQGATPYAQLLQAAKSVHTTCSAHRTNQQKPNPVSTKSLVPDDSVSSQIFQFSRNSSPQKYSLVASDIAKPNGRLQTTDHLKRPGAPHSYMEHPIQTSHRVTFPPTPVHSKQEIKSKPKPPKGLRRGKWTVEEEAYVARVIQDFNCGYLNAPAGTTLRSYLSEKLHCDPMRITKKFTGESCIGKRVFHPAVRCPSNTAAIDKAQAELDALERRWRRRLEMQQRESAKKAAASAAAAASVVISGENHVYPPIQPNNKTLAPRSITKTASWLDRANTVLAAPQEQARAAPKTTIENQMKEVQRLIHEGKQTTSFIHDQQVNSPPQLQDPSKPLDKRPRRHSGAEDAEALVGFFNSVRAAAATASRSALD